MFVVQVCEFKLEFPASTSHTHTHSLYLTHTHTTHAGTEPKQNKKLTKQNKRTTTTKQALRCVAVTLALGRQRQKVPWDSLIGQPVQPINKLWVE